MGDGYTTANDGLHDRRTQQQAAADVTQYTLWKPHKIKEALYGWVNDYPDFVRITTSQDAYGLPTAGGASDCPYDDDVTGCKNYILTLQDYIQHPEGSDSSNALPEVFLSGELHGNERVGPTAVMEAAKLMLLAADCESKPRRPSTGQQHSFNSEKSTDWASELQAAKTCRKDLKALHGMDDVHRKWLARLVATRRIVIVPTANALGYYQNRREEGRADPNRDFPYDVEDAKDCMKTIAGRTLNEVFRDHMFQLSLTFHGGMEVVGYEWGAPTWLEHLSPDDQGQSVIGAAYSKYGGNFKTSPAYKYGTMNDLVYFVRGGFEDWAYAASWDPDRVIPCQPTTFGGYDANKTKYDNSTLRVFNMLVETSNSKEPSESTLGTSFHVFEKDTTGNGHVSRNIRLSLLAVDAVQPYVGFTGINDVTMSDDVVPLTQEKDRSCQESKAVMVPGDQQNVMVRWTVGGAFDIDTTELWFTNWDRVPKGEIHCVDQPSKAQVEKYFTKLDIVGPATGTGFFSASGSVPKDDKLESLGPVFQAELDVSQFKAHDKLILVATAKVDQSWTKQPADFEPKLPPQSHVVNARTNPSWRHESSNGKIIQGRLDWYSRPLTVIVGDYEVSVGTQAGRQVGTVEHSNRFGETTGDIIGGITPSSAMDPSATGGSFSKVYLLAIGGVLVCSVVLYKAYRRSRRKARRMQNSSEDQESYMDDEDDDEEVEFGMPSSGYSDKEVELKSYGNE